MRKHNHLRFVGVCFTLLLAAPVADAAIKGRFVRIEAPASARMGIHEIEVWSGGTNIALKNENLKFAGRGFRGGDINDRNRGRALIDGVVERKKRFPEYSTAGSMNTWLEMDFGAEHLLDKIVFKSTRKPTHYDRSVRLVTVLDAQRRVLWATTCDIRRKPFDKGTATFALAAGKGPLIGRVVPANTGAWVPLADVLEVTPAPTSAETAERLKRFATRNSPAAIKQLAREFFARMDPGKPELADVRTRFEKQDYAGALDAYCAHFLRKIQRAAILNVGGGPLGMIQPNYPTAAEDLMRNVAVHFERFGVSAQAFEPGALDWTATDRMVGSIQAPLLHAFFQTGKPEYLQQWAAITDDWGMHLIPTLERAAADGRDLRDYFVKGVLQGFNRFAAGLALTAKERPELAKHLSGATLARLLMPVLEEYPPAYWWVCRRASFNHTYNAMNAAAVSARLLDDFYAGQRLDRENRRHWQRVWSTMVTRDGSMNEIGDEGHLTMHWRMALIVDHLIKRMPSPWFSPDFLREFETGWRMTATYPLRHLAPDGYGHRMGRSDYFPKFWWLINPKEGYKELFASDTLDNTAIVRHPEFAGILQSVFGAGRDREKLSARRQAYYDQITGYYGKDFTPPKTISDWMPYAGLWYLRRSWEPDATYVHMICQPKGHPSTNGSAWNTELHYFDFAQPLLALSPVWVDGKWPFPGEPNTYKPGSKTERLATASEFPIPARWHTSDFCDYAESFFEGTYRQHGNQFHSGGQGPPISDPAIRDVRAERRVILLRPTRLVIVTDAVDVPGAARNRTYEVRQRFAIPEPAGQHEPGSFRGDARELTLINEDAPGVTVRRFTTAKLSWDKRETPDNWSGASLMSHLGVKTQVGGRLCAESDGDLLMTALTEPHPETGESTVKHVVDLSGENVSGFEATLDDGTTVTWLSTDGEPRKLAAGRLSLHGQGLLLYDHKGQSRGIILGGKSLRLGGKQVKLPAADLEFAIRNAQFAVRRAIHRPIVPVTFSPQEAVFSESQQVTLSSATPGVQIRYTLDGAEPDLGSPLYTKPLTIDKDSYIRARAFRPDVKEMPFTADGTEVTVVSEARFYRRDPIPARKPPRQLTPGLTWELVDGSVFQLFSYLHLPEVLPAVAEGHTERVPDVSMREGDGPFGVRYRGVIDIPADGVWTFHAPAEYVGATCEPGYDLRVWIDGEQWDLGRRFHGRGLWSVPLAKGPHRLLVTFADARHRDRTVHNSGLWRGYPKPWVVWKGEAPTLEISGPGMSKQPLPEAWLRH